MRLGIQGSRFTIDGRPTFLLGVSYYGALGAADQFVLWDLHELRELGFNWVRVWATWAAFGNNVSAVTERGEPREPYVTRLRRFCAAAEEMGLAVDVTLLRGNGTVGASLDPDLDAHLRAVATLAEELRPFRHLYFDLANERNLPDRRHVPTDELKHLRHRCRAIDPERLVTASHCGDLTAADVAGYLSEVAVDFLAPHRPRHSASPAETADATAASRAAMRQLGRELPVHYQEPFRRGFGEWQPQPGDFLADLRQAVRAGAAGWCFHNGHDDRRPDGRPRRSFDLRQSEGRLFDQLEPEELQVLERALGVVQGA